MVGSSLLRQKMGLPMGTDPATFGKISFYTPVKTNTRIHV